MAWNEPGGGKRDPWKGKKEAPDVDAMLRRVRDGFGRLFGGNGGPTSLRRLPDDRPRAGRALDRV